MPEDRPTTGTDGLPLPILPPEGGARVWARNVRVMFYTPGFLAPLLINTGEPEGFGITVELLMLASAAAIVASYTANRQGVLKLKRTQTTCNAHCPRRSRQSSGPGADRTRRP